MIFLNRFPRENLQPRGSGASTPALRRRR